MSTTPHKASADQWAMTEKWAKGCTYESCLIEIRDRLEALELEAAMSELCAASAEVRPTVKESLTADASSLVERVAGAIADAGWDTDSYDPEARAAIREVAAWMVDRGGYPWAWVAQILEKEAGR